MAQIIKFPTQASKLGYRRVRKKGQAEHPDQLNLFVSPGAQILNLPSGGNRFDQALMLDERGDMAAAEFYRKAIEEQDFVADAYCNLGIIESQSGNVGKAFDCFTTALKQDPRHSEAHYNLGNLYFEVNDFRLAQVHYEIACEIEPAFANAYFNLALIQSINNDLAAAVSALSKYQQLAAKDDARNADELMETLKRSLAAKSSRFGET